MSQKIAIPQVTRIEGHLSVHAESEPVGGDGKGFRVTEAHCEGEMFRGFEKILEGRDPLDAQQIIQRVCGVCPISHGMASVRAQEMAYGIKPNRNGRLMQNLLFAANYLHSHVAHLYLLSALDFVDVKALLGYSGDNALLRKLRTWVEQSIARKDLYPGAPLLPRFEVPYIQDANINLTLVAHYAEALEVRKIADEMGAIVGARLPHSTALIPGGVTQVPTMERISSYLARLKRVAAFIENVYIPDVIALAGLFPDYFDIGRGPGNMLCYGVFEMDDAGNRLFRPGVLINGKWEAFDQAKITEDAGTAWFDVDSGLHPSRGDTIAAPSKKGAYTWLKAPRYAGQVMEVGPLARVLVNYHDPSNTWVKAEVDKVLGELKLPAEKLVSVLGRHLARALEAKWVAQQCYKWLEELEVDGPPAQDFKIVRNGSGYGLTEAPRGALGHWLEIENYKIRRYQCVVPTTWNCSPRDDKGVPGAVEAALAGTIVADPAQPIELARIVRSFDPCLACAVH